MPKCDQCEKDKELGAFERYKENNYRRKCKECRNENRKKTAADAREAEANAVAKGVELVPPVLPDRCKRCNKPPSEVKFTLRSDRKRRIFRIYCNDCDNERRTAALKQKRQKTLATDCT